MAPLLCFQHTRHNPTSGPLHCCSLYLEWYILVSFGILASSLTSSNLYSNVNVWIKLKLWASQYFNSNSPEKEPASSLYLLSQTPNPSLEKKSLLPPYQDVGGNFWNFPVSFSIQMLGRPDLSLLRFLCLEQRKATTVIILHQLPLLLVLLVDCGWPYSAPLGDKLQKAQKIPLSELVPPLLKKRTTLGLRGSEWVGGSTGPAWAEQYRGETFQIAEMTGVF